MSMADHAEQQVILVCGASRGIGAAIASIAAGWKARVVITARSAQALASLAHQIEAAGGSALPIPGDSSKEADAREIIQRTLETYGRLDALVYNSGQIEPIAPLAETNLQDWEQSLRVNLLGAVLFTQLAIPSLREVRGRIVYISSGAAEDVIPGWSSYSTAKAAIDHLARILAEEEPAITTLAVRPGVVDTAMQATIRQEGKGRMGERNYNRLSGLYEQNRLLPPEKPGRAIAALALYAPHDLSGQVLSWNDPQVQAVIP